MNLKWFLIAKNYNKQNGKLLFIPNINLPKVVQMEQLERRYVQQLMQRQRPSIG